MRISFDIHGATCCTGICRARLLGRCSRVCRGGHCCCLLLLLLLLLLLRLLLLLLLQMRCLRIWR